MADSQEAVDVKPGSKVQSPVLQAPHRKACCRTNPNRMSHLRAESEAHAYLLGHKLSNVNELVASRSQENRKLNLTAVWHFQQS